MADRLFISLLGSFQAVKDDKSLVDFESDKARAMLAYLAVEAQRPHRRDMLAGLLWSDSPERTARTNLRSALANVRQVIGDHQEHPPYLEITRQTIQFNRSSDAWLDVAAFNAGLDRSAQEVDARDPEGFAAFAGAVELYRGQFLAGFNLRNAQLFEEWALITGESLQRKALRAMQQLTACYQETGAYEEAIQLARRQIELEPYQEAAHQQLMWSLALNGQRNEALLDYEHFESLLFDELGVAPLEQTQEMAQLILDGQLPASPSTHVLLRREPNIVGACPYRGLSAFREEDAPFFYGREAFTAHLAGSIEQQEAVVVIVGSSGSGKSSVLSAGLLPVLREKGDWLIVQFRPGSKPFQSLAASISPYLKSGRSENNSSENDPEPYESLRDGTLPLTEMGEQILENEASATQLLLVIDQFEELYTVCTDEAQRRRFLELLLEVVQEGESRHAAPLILVLTLRADFMGQALSFRPFADTLNDSSLILGPMNREELRAAIEKPALQQGAGFEPGLVTRILDDVGSEPGNLPLLEFALTQLWERLDQGWLTHAAYEEIGRTGGALARYAESVFLALNDEQRADARRVLVQLVQPGQGTEDSRRLGLRHEFSDAAWNLVQYLADKRLVVTGQESEGKESAELIHETLIREWKRLRGWLDADRAFRVWQEQLRVALRQWEDSDHDDGALLRGVPLSIAENWLLERPDDLSILDQRFIQAGLDKRRDRLLGEQVRQERESSLERRSRSLLQVLVVVLALATVVSIGLALIARNEARQAIEASSLSLAATAQQALSDKDATSALPLALAANRIEAPPQKSQRALLEAAYSPGPRDLYAVSEIFADAGSTATSIAASPDGQSAFAGLSDGQVVLWDIATGEEIQRFSETALEQAGQNSAPASGSVNDLVISPDEQIVIAAMDNGDIILWDAGTGEEIRRLAGHSGAVRTLAVSPDGSALISGGLSGQSLREPGELILWDLKTGQEIRRFEGFEEAVLAAAFSPDGRTVIASSGEVDYLSEPGQVYDLIAWDVESGEIMRHFEGIDRHITDVDTILSCADAADSAKASCDTVVLTGSADHNLYLWSLDSGERLQILEGRSDLIKAVAYSPDGRRVLSGDDEGQLHLWNIDKGEIIARFDVHGSGVNDITFTPDGRAAISTAADGTIAVLDLFNAAQINRLHGHEAAVLDIAFSPDGKKVVSASGSSDPAAPIIEEDSLRLWNLENGEQSGTLDWHLNDIFQIAISPDGRRVLSGMMLDQSVRLWDVATGREIQRFEGHVAPVLSVAFSPDGRRGLSGAVDSTIITWDLGTGAALGQLTGHEGGIWALAISPDGNFALSGADDRLMILWDQDTGEEVQRFAGHTETVSGVAFSPDGNHAFSGDTEGNLIEWDLESGEEIQRFVGHGGSGPVGRTRVAYLPDVDDVAGERMALSSGWDGTLALWDLAKGEELRRFSGHDTDFIFDIAISPDGRSALSSGTDKTIIQWRLDTPTLDDLRDWIAANRYVRDLSCEERALYQIEPLC